MQTLRILFLGGAKRVSLAERFVIAGNKLGYDIQFYSYELDEDVPISAMGKVFVGLKWKDPLVYKDLVNIIEEYNINILIPNLDPATIVAARLKELYSKIFIPVSDIKVCEIFFNKNVAQNWFKQNGIPVPSENLNEFPLITKPVRGSASKNITLLKTLTELESFIENHNKEEFIIQKFIEGEEFTVDGYITKQNKVLAIVPRKRLEVIGGEVSKAITIKDDKLINYARTVFENSGLRGPVNIQFIQDKNNEYYAMEVNPRFGGGVIASIEAGADFTEMVLKEYLGLPLEEISNWKNHLIMMRTNREFFRHADNN